MNAILRNALIIYMLHSIISQHDSRQFFGAGALEKRRKRRGKRGRKGKKRRGEEKGRRRGRDGHVWSINTSANGASMTGMHRAQSQQIRRRSMI